MDKTLTIGFDAKRIMRNGTGLGNYCRTLVNDLALYDSNLQLRLYAPDMGKKELREQLEKLEKVGLADAPLYYRDWDDIDHELTEGVYDICEGVVLG